MYSHQLKEIAVDKRASRRRCCPSVTSAWTSTAFEAAEIHAFLCDFIHPEQDVPDESPTSRRNSDQPYAISGISAATASPAVMLANSARHAH